MGDAVETPDPPAVEPDGGAILGRASGPPDRIGGAGAGGPVAKGPTIPRPDAEGVPAAGMQ
jgi:hypothetical protein